MKKNINTKSKISVFITLTVITIFSFVNSCKKDSENSKQSVINGKLINHSVCKNGLKSANISDSLSCVDYSFDNGNNILTIKHINAGFNCCPDSFYCNISTNNDTIIIQESEKASLCNCDCLYDLDIEVRGVSAKKYQIKLIEPYSGDQKKIWFELDLTKVKAGSFCATRKEYPWNLNN